jgi:hypothetical protein
MWYLKIHHDYLIIIMIYLLSRVKSFFLRATERWRTGGVISRYVATMSSALRQAKNTLYNTDY